MIFNLHYNLHPPSWSLVGFPPILCTHSTTLNDNSFHFYVFRLTSIFVEQNQYISYIYHSFWFFKCFNRKQHNWYSYLAPLGPNECWLNIFEMFRQLLLNWLNFGDVWLFSMNYSITESVRNILPSAIHLPAVDLRLQIIMIWIAWIR